jgi:hypothetical protein
LLLVSASAIDAGILMFDITDVLPADGSWYLVGPLAIWTAAGTAASFALFNRLMHQIEAPQTKISAQLIDEGGSGRRIPWYKNGQTTTLLTSVAPWRIAQPEAEARSVRRVQWEVPVETMNGQVEVLVSEPELKAFLEVAYNRSTYPLSRRYWTKKRKPPLWRPRYEAYIKLLDSAELIEGRYDRASGRLRLHPRQAVLLLRNASGYLSGPN